MHLIVHHSIHFREAVMRSHSLADAVAGAVGVFEVTMISAVGLEPGIAVVGVVGFVAVVDGDFAVDECTVGQGAGIRDFESDEPFHFCGHWQESRRGMASHFDHHVTGARSETLPEERTMFPAHVTWAKRQRWGEAQQGADRFQAHQWQTHTSSSQDHQGHRRSCVREIWQLGAGC